jgi:hypothetical protein
MQPARLRARIDSEFVPNGPPQLVVDRQGGRGVAAFGQGLRQQPVPDLGQRRALDQPPRRPFGAGQFGTADVQACLGVAGQRPVW